MDCDGLNSKGSDSNVNVPKREIDKENKDYLGMFFGEIPYQGDIYTPSNIAGMYRQLINAYLADTIYNSVNVTPAIHTDQIKDHGNPVVVIKRKTISPSGLGVMGGKGGVDAASIPNSILNQGNISVPDSASYAHFQNLELELSIYADHLAEAETLGYYIYRFLMGYANDVLRQYSDGIKFVTAPTFTEVLPSKKHKQRFEAYISWNVQYLDRTVLLMEKNVIKYLNITVSEDNSTNVISSDGLLKF